MTAYPLSFLIRPPGTPANPRSPGTVTAQSDAVSVAAGAAIDVLPLDNDTSSDNTPLYISRIITGPSAGVLEIADDDRLRYTAPQAAGTYFATIEVRSGSGGTATSSVTLTVTGGGGTTAGLAVPWGVGQGGSIIGPDGTWERHYGHRPSACAGWTGYTNLKSPTIFAGGSLSTNLDTYNKLFDGLSTGWAPNVARALNEYGDDTLHVWVFPFVPTNWSYKDNAGIYGTFKTGGSNNTTWKSMWFSVGYRTASMIKRTTNSSATYSKFIMDVGWEMTNFSYDWSVGNSEADYRTARMIAIDEFRRGANSFESGAGDKIRWMLRVSANKNSGSLQNLWTDKDHDPIIGRSWHENFPDPARVSGTGRPWHTRTGWTAEVNGTWGGHKLDEVAQFAVDRGLKLGMSEVGHAKISVSAYEMPSRSPVTAVDKIFWWCKRWEQHLHHWCWLHSSNRPMVGTGWTEAVPNNGTWEVANRIRDLFNGTRSPTFRDIFLSN